MIDIHSHLLFGVDDGPKKIEDSMHILEQAVRDGITNMVVTPHAYNPHYHVSRKEVEEQIVLLRDVIQTVGHPLTLHMGQEVRLHDSLLESVASGEAITLAGSRYLLLELPSQSVPAYTVHIIQSLLKQGIIPIIAHPERNRAIAEKPERLERLIRHGAFAQVTAGSVSGHFGKGVQKVALRLIESNLIHVYGSDVHNVTTRPLAFNEGLDVLEKKKLHEYIDIFFENNSRILADEQLIQLELAGVKSRKWWQMSR